MSFARRFVAVVMHYGWTVRIAVCTENEMHLESLCGNYWDPTGNSPIR